MAERRSRHAASEIRRPRRGKAKPEADLLTLVEQMEKALLTISLGLEPAKQ